MPLTPSEIGERTEAAILAALVGAGKRVVLPFGEQRRYDLAFEEGSRLIKVQCKTGWLRAGAIHFRTHSLVHGTIRDYLSDIDLFAVYCHEIGQAYLVPVRDVPSKSRATLRLDPPKNGQSQKIRWADQYLVSRHPIPRLLPSPAARAHKPGRPDRQLSILTDIDIDAILAPMKELQQVQVACCTPLSEATISPQEADAAATLFKALADPHRVLILNRLLACGDAVCVCELNEDLDLSQPTVSFHLKKLVSAGLLSREQRGTWAYYSVVPHAMDQLSQLFRTKESV